MRNMKRMAAAMLTAVALACGVAYAQNDPTPPGPHQYVWQVPIDGTNLGDFLGVIIINGYHVDQVVVSYDGPDRICCYTVIATK